MALSSSSTKVVIVTGASRGIGKATSLHLLSKNVSVVGIARSADTLSTLSEEVAQLQTAAKFLPVVGDITDQSVQQQAADYAAQNGTLIALVNNAGTNMPLASIATGSVDDWSNMFAVNVIAPLSMTQRVIPQLRQSKGRVINLSSTVYKIPFKEAVCYGATKAAINYITATLASEEPDITAVAIHPGLVNTDMTRVFFYKAFGVEPSKSSAGDLSIPSMIEADVPGRIIGNLALHVDHELTGAFVEYNEPKLARYAE
ncbi:NAD(P)-binding protein [Linderina pennispora]|uniref:NAD(P)-binding protein n=1 Tax=Linderina pennispora TaxID=61395 RepID=A0A1Y1WJQ6_9FUNG|nr:NAD(P)-binding protein [Linderina pennispora]ORX73712.1 NAD(P)-binding protein [Linderina pennispora]